jgi:AcrR family transcriptional regulator
VPSSRPRARARGTVGSGRLGPGGARGGRAGATVTRVSLSRADYVAAALAFIDGNGYEALTLRTLGDALGVSHTALYRHFPDRATLLTAVSDALVEEAMSVPPPAGLAPRDRIVHRFRRIKAAFAAHPNVVVPTATTGGPRPAQLVWTRDVVADLEAMGLGGAALVQAFRLLEGYGVGTTLFDLGGAPDHLELRRQRMRALEHPAFDEASRSVEDVAADNELAFERGLHTLLDLCERVASEH